jgi:hypothetical protein
MNIFDMRARIGLKTLPIDRKSFYTYVYIHNNITKVFLFFRSQLSVRNDWHIFRFSLFRVLTNFL